MITINVVSVAFYLSSNGTKEPMILFFNKIKQIVGKTYWMCKIFMSDDDSVFYEAWKEVIGPTKLHCWWHINKNWDKHLNEKIKHANKWELVKKHYIHYIHWMY